MFFDNVENIGGAGNQETLEKALTAGYGTNAADYTGGRALQPEDLETTLVNVLTTRQADFKVFNSLQRQTVKSTEHQYVRRLGIGDDGFLFVAEGEGGVESDQEIERKSLAMKYIITKGSITKQMEMVSSLEDAYNSEKLAATIRICRAAERGIFHGDSSIIGTQFDGLLKSITDSANNISRSEDKRATVVDLHGYEIGEDVAATDKDILTHEDLFDDIATKVFEKGGDLTKALFPPVVAGQFRNLYNKKLRYMVGDNHLGLAQLPDIPTAIGSSIRIKGNDAGADKMFFIKDKVASKGDTLKRPNAPASVSLTVNASPVKGESKFRATDAGDYTYVVHAINQYGISAGTAAGAAATVAAGKSVSITITPDSNGAVPTGYIITRSAKDGSIVMEMVTIPAQGATAVIYEDCNDDLPGTANIILLSELTQEAKQNLAFAQLMALSTFPLPITDGLTKPFAVALFGALEHRAPEFDALIKNVGVQGCLY